MRQARRALHVSDHSLHSCLHSIAHDQVFVEHVIRALRAGDGEPRTSSSSLVSTWHTGRSQEEEEEEDGERNTEAKRGGCGGGLALFANLRCGLWYTPFHPARVARCYFKSTDGHTGNYAFSSVRLNVHVALACASHGGCVVIDATRRGKRFPDALSKTLPIWCCVVSRAVGWTHEKLRLAPGVPEMERADIETKLDEFVAIFLRSGADVDALRRALVRPMRPMWVSTETRLWSETTNAQDGPMTMSMTERHMTDARSPDDSCLRAREFYPVVCVSASETEMRRIDGYGAEHACTHLERTRIGDAESTVLPSPSSSSSSSSFVYIPGAGDDEEAWSLGITPESFWENKEALLAAAPADVDALARSIAAAYHTAPTSVGISASWIGDTGLGIGAAGAGRPPEVWRTAGAVVNLGTLEFPAMRDESTRGRYMRVRIDMKSKHSLDSQLGGIVDFARAHLVRGTRVLFHCDTGEDISVCACLAALVTLFAWDDERMTILTPLFRVSMLSDHNYTCDNANAGDAFSSHEHPLPIPTGEEVTKSSVRHRLAFLSAHCPSARPSRLMLKQVYAFTCTPTSSTSL